MSKQFLKTELFIGALIGFNVLGIFFYSFHYSDLSDGQPSSPSSVPLASDLITFPTEPILTSPTEPISVSQNRNLPSSTVLTAPGRTGLGSLNVSNGTSRDAHIKIVDPHSLKLVAALYVKSNSTFTLKQIPDGVYQVIFVSGEDWDSKTQSFTRNRSFKRFDNSFNFVTTKETKGRSIYTHYTIFEITLHPVSHGHAPTSGINEQEFDRY